MKVLAEHWLSILLIGGVIFVGAKLFFGPQGLGNKAGTGQGGEGLGNTAGIMLAVALFAFAAFDIISEGRLSAAVGSVFLTLFSIPS